MTTTTTTDTDEQPTEAEAAAPLLKGYGERLYNYWLSIDLDKRPLGWFPLTRTLILGFAFLAASSIYAAWTGEEGLNALLISSIFLLCIDFGHTCMILYKHKKEQKEFDKTVASFEEIKKSYEDLHKTYKDLSDSLSLLIAENQLMFQEEMAIKHGFNDEEGNPVDFKH